MMTLILDQDRDEIIPYSGTQTLSTLPILYDGKIIGMGVYIDDRFVGSFNTIEECLKEINCIRYCEYPYYVVNGFSDYLGLEAEARQIINDNKEYIDFLMELDYNEDIEQ